MVFVATHKRCKMPKSDFYVPLEVGVACHGRKTKWVGDNRGENISEKNESFSELTGIYWIWKNVKNDYKGLVHYRRHLSVHRFVFGGVEAKLSKVLSKREVSRLLDRADVVLPVMRNYYIENLYGHYVHTLHGEPLDMTGRIIKKKYAKYWPEFQNLHKRKTAHMFNMMIMKREIFDDYADWLFSVLFDLEKEVKKTGLHYDAFHGRFYGRVSELLLDVYIRTNKIEYVETPMVSIGSINWMKKVYSFIAAKMFRKKYSKSF